MWALIQDGKVQEVIKSPKTIVAKQEIDDPLYDRKGVVVSTRKIVGEVTHSADVFLRWTRDERKTIGLYDFIQAAPLARDQRVTGTSYVIDDEKGEVTEVFETATIPQAELDLADAQQNLQSSLGGLALADRYVPRAFEDLIQVLINKGIAITPDDLPEQARMYLIEKQRLRQTVQELAPVVAAAT